MSLLNVMEEANGVGQGPDQDGDEDLSTIVPRTRMDALVNAISQYQDVYPVLQRGVQLLRHELCDGDVDDDEVAHTIRAFIATGALEETVSAMTANLDSPTFASSCLKLLVALLAKSDGFIADALWKTEILTVLDKSVHNVIYQNEPECVQLGINLLTKLVGNLESIGSGLWTQLISTTAQAMLTNSLNHALQLECLLSLKMLFQLKIDAAVPATPANIILKTLDQYFRHPVGISRAFASASAVVIFRILDASSRTTLLGHYAPTLAAVLHKCHLTLDLYENHKIYVEKLIQQPLHSAVQDSLSRLIEPVLPPAESDTEGGMAAFHIAAVKLLLAVAWSEEARAFLDGGGVVVLINVFTSRSVLKSAAIETALAQTLYYVSMHWPDETWNEMQVNDTGLSKWISIISERCEDENDVLLHFLLGTLKSLVRCERFSEALAGSGVVDVLQSVLHKHHQLPLCARLIVNILLSISDKCPTTSLPALCESVAETMIALKADRSSQLECVKALTLLVSQQCESQTLLSNQHVRDIVRVMRSTLMDEPFTTEMLCLVVDALKLNANIRAAFIDRGLLQVVSKAICMYQWSPTESAGSHARWIICEIAHKLDVSRNLSPLEPHAHIAHGHTFNSTAMSVEALDSCCCVIGALACVKPLLSLLVEEGAIRCIVGALRYAKQELIIRSENSFAQVVTTCFYAASNIVNAPAVREALNSVTTEDTIGGQSIYSRLVNSGAVDAIIGCLEETLQANKIPSLLVDSGCRLLQSVLAFPVSISCEAQNRWIAVATSILQRECTQPRTRELLFGTTLIILSQGKRSGESAKGQQTKLMKVILGLLNDSLEHERSCTLLQAECIGAVRVLEEISKASDSVPDTLVSRCLGVLGKLVATFVLSPSTTAQENLRFFDSAIAQFTTTGYVNRLLFRLYKCTTKEGAMMETGEDFKALEALLRSSQGKKSLDAYHGLFGYLGAVVENVSEYAKALGDQTLFFLELGCLSCQLLPISQREHVINAALCHFAEDTTWHSMRWIAALADRGSSEFTLIVEFVLLRIVSGHTILEPALLMELLDALDFLLRCSQCREIVQASSHAKELQGVLWELVRADVAHKDAETEEYDVAISLLGIISSLISSFSSEIFSIQSEENGCEVLVRFCLGALDSFFVDTKLDVTKLSLSEEVLQTTGIILHHCIQLGAEYARSIIQHRATRHAFNISVGAARAETKSCEKWSLVVLGAITQSHGLIYAERLLRLSSDPSALLTSLVDMVVQNSDVLSWKCFLDCITLVHGPSETASWQSDCSALCEKLQQHTKDLVPGPATVLNSRKVTKHIADTIAQLSFKYGQLTLDTTPAAWFQAIVRSGLSFYDLFMAAPSFEASEYSVVVSLHLRIARLAGLSPESERSTIEELTVSIRKLLNPICISDEALADYLDLAATVYLSPSIRAAAWLFVDTTTHVLSKVIQRLTTGLIRSKYLEKSLLNAFSSLRVVYGSRWESGEVDSALELLKIFSPDKWSQDQLLESLLELPQGLLHLFKLARAAPGYSAQVMIFLFQHVNDIRHNTHRIGELELSAILSIVKRNVAGRVGDTSQRKWREVSGSEMLRCALEILKLLARRKNCAVLCSELGGINVLYDVLCAPSQYEDVTHLALEICCYLAGFGVDFTHENSTFALQLLFVFVKTNVDSSRSHLAALVLEYFLALNVSALSLPLIQQCRTQLVSVASRSDEEAEMFIQQLYIARQKLALPTQKPEPQVSRPKSNTGKAFPLNESEIRRIILSSCRTIVQCTDGQGGNSYVNVKTSEKSMTEPREYIRLREAIEQLSFVLDDPDTVMNRDYVSAFVPALSEILVLHTVTTATMCTIMQILEQIAFVNPSIVLSSDQMDIMALFASCSLHHRASQAFARHLCRFCNSVGVELREDKFGLAITLVPLLFELLVHWKTDFEVVDQGLATLHDLVAVIHIEEFERLRCGDILALLNAAVASYTSSSPTSWNWLKCMLTTLIKLDKVPIESAQDTINTAIDIIRMFMSHSFMVELAVFVLIRMYIENRQLPLRHLSESNGVEILLTCLKLHANDASIVSGCLRLMVSLASRGETLPKTVDQLLAAEAAAPILLVSKKNPDNPSICGMCIELVYQLVKSFENHPGKKPRMSVLPGYSTRKKSELLEHLLEADIIPLIFDLLDSYSSRGDDHLLESLLLLLKSLTKDERLRDSAEVLHGLQELQQTIDRIWEKYFDCVLVELAIDCLVNMACFDRAIGHGWRELPMWLLKLAKFIDNLEPHRTGMCVEKLIGILGRLAVDSATSTAISPKGSFTVLKLLARVGPNYSLEQALYGLLCALCEDVACAQILIVYNAIPITADRIICHVHDEDTLLSSLCFLDLLVLNSGDSYPALQDEGVFEALDLAIQTYPEITGSQVYRIASTTLEKISALDYQSTRRKPGAAKMLKSRIQVPDSQKPFHDLLREGAKFRVIWEARPDTIESIQIQLAPSGDYLLFRRKASSQLPRVERIFASQLEVCPQRSLVKLSSPSKKILAQSLLKGHFEGDRVLRLKIRDENVLIKTGSTRERVHWDQALQWLVSHRETRTSPGRSPTHSPVHSSQTFLA